MRGLVTSEERQMIREKSGWECCDICDSPISCAKDCCCAKHGDEPQPTAAEFDALADDYERGLKKMTASGYEEFGPDVLRRHEMVITALRAYALR